MIKTLFSSLAVVGCLAMTGSPALADPPRATFEIHIGTSRPPVVRREVRTVAPAPGYVWVDGWWDWQGDQWVWIEGHWEQTAPHARWVRAAYVPEYGRYRYVPAHWSNVTIVEGADYRSWKEQRKHEREQRKHHRHGH